MTLTELRQHYHRQIAETIIYVTDDGIPNFADADSKLSSLIAREVLERLSFEKTLDAPIKGQTAGRRFENVNREFLGAAFSEIKHLRPGRFVFDLVGDISKFRQYKHLGDLTRLLDEYTDLQSALGTDSDYLIKPDIIVARYPVSDEEINLVSPVIQPDDQLALLTPLRRVNHNAEIPLLHASISAKWTLRSDRAQNARTEALNLIRNRKGSVPVIVTVTAEPMPSRIASLALGTGDVDCVYHFALPELRDAVQSIGNELAIEMLEMMVSGDRLRDISDLPLDLAI